MEQQMKKRDYSKKSPNQIIRMNKKDGFVEVMNSMFPMGKIVFNFAEYDVKQAAGSRINQSAHVYLGFPEFLRIYNDIMDSKIIINEITKRKEKAKEEGQKYPKPFILSQGGGMVKGKLVSRILEIERASVGKNFVVLRCKNGEGVQDENGLVVPNYKGKPENQVMIPFTAEQLKEFLMTIKLHIDAYMAAEYGRKFSELFPNEK